MTTLEKPQFSDLQEVSSERSSLDSNKQQVHPCISLPLAFKIYCDKARFAHSVFYIGRQKSERLNAISSGYVKWVQATVALHEGPQVDSPVLGSSVIKGKTVDVTLPTAGAVQMQGKSSSASKFSFTLPTEASTSPERFEWRRSHEEEVKSLGGRGAGWELVRLDGPNTTDAEEVVAVYSVDLWSPKLSGRFKFLGSGAAEELGREWAIMAVVTALSLGQKQRDQLVLAAVS